MALAAAAVELDTDMVEINPLVVTSQGQVMALDAKVAFDKNALFRHPELAELRDLSEEEPAETLAAEYGLSFIKLSGSIGCLVNGAGLAMATMDTIKEVGGEPANFLDVGGGATVENVTAAFEIITATQREGHLRQHLRRHHAVRHHRHRRAAGRRNVGLGCRWWCGWRGPTWSSASASSRRPGLPGPGRRRAA
jgi:hypothetical protein